MDTLQENIISVSSRLFEQFGIRSVSIDNVCKELLISKKTFYTLFPQKEDLVDSVLTFQNKNNCDKFSKLFKNKNSIDSLILIIKEIKRNIESVSQTMFFDLEKYYPRIFEKHMLKNNEEIRLGFEINLRQGIAEGYYREDLDIELISLFHSLQIKNTFELMQQSPKKYPKKRIIEFFLDLMIHMIANEKGLQYLRDQSISETF